MQISQVEIYPMPSFPTLVAYRSIFNGPVHNAQLRSIDEIMDNTAKGFKD